jgi:chromosome segregation ATPase
MANDDIELNSFTKKFEELRQERDFFKIRVEELEKSLTISETIKERIEKELTHVRAQFDNLKATIIEKETVIQDIAGMLLAHVEKKKPEMSLPPRPKLAEPVRRESSRE